MENWDEQAPAVAELPEIKLFGKWSTDDVQVSDISLTVSRTSEPSHQNRKGVVTSTDFLIFIKIKKISSQKMQS